MLQSCSVSTCTYYFFLHQEMSELQVVGHFPGHAPRPRADSLDSLGEEEGEGLSSSEGGSEEGEMVEGYA